MLTKGYASCCPDWMVCFIRRTSSFRSMPRSVCNVGDWTDSGVSNGGKKNGRVPSACPSKPFACPQSTGIVGEGLESSGCSRSQGHELVPR